MKNKDFVRIQTRLRPQFPDFESKGRIMFARPLGHVLRGFHFDPSAFAEDGFYVDAFFLPLYIPTKHLHLTFGHRLGRKWTCENNHLELELSRVMSRELPFIKQLSTAEGIVDALQRFVRPNEQGYVNPHSYEALAYALLMAGDVENAANIMNTPTLDRNSEKGWEQEIISRIQLVKGLLAKNLAAAIAQLSLWESESKKELKLADFD